MNLAGEVIYVVTNPSDVTAAYRNNSTLSMDVFLQDLMEGFGISPVGRKLVYESPTTDGSGIGALIADNPKRKKLAHLLVDWFRQQLHPGPSLTDMGQVVMSYMEKSTRWAAMDDPRYVLATPSHDTKEISLAKWCESVIVSAAVRSFFGDALMDSNPDLLDYFMAFDIVSWKLLYRYPHILCKDMHAAKDHLVGALKKYFRLPLESRPGANWLVRMMETEIQNLGVDKDDFCKMIGLIFWVINTNAPKLLFWMLAFMFQDKELSERVTEELRTMLRPDGTIDIPALQNQTPYLMALFNEALRLCNSSASAREVTQDTQIGPYTLKAGHKLLIPYRQLHMNENAFGSDVMSFDYSRFFKNDKLARNPSYRPFGGGATFCPGAYLAKQEIFMAMTYLLCRNEVTMDPVRNQQFPRMDEIKPGIGIIGPLDGDDVVLTLKQKQQD